MIFTRADSKLVHDNGCGPLYTPHKKRGLATPHFDVLHAERLTHIATTTLGRPQTTEPQQSCSTRWRWRWRRVCVRQHMLCSHHLIQKNVIPKSKYYENSQFRFEFVIFILNSITNENLQNMRIHYAMHSTLLERGERTAVRVVISNRHIQNLVVCTWEVCRWISCFTICTYTVIV